MVRKLCTLLAVLVLGLAVFAAVGCERVEASGETAVSESQAAPVLVSNEQTASFTAVHPVYVIETALLSNKNKPPVLEASTFYCALPKQVLVRRAENYDDVFIAVRQKPKLGFSGVAYVHFARADV